MLNHKDIRPTETNAKDSFTKTFFLTLSAFLRMENSLADPIEAKLIDAVEIGLGDTKNQKMPYLPSLRRERGKSLRRTNGHTSS